MKITAGLDDVRQGYEALRALATGGVAAITPRGMALFHRAGLVSWMAACAPLRPASSVQGAIPKGESRATALAAMSSELVRVLAEMAVSSQRRQCA